MRAGSASSAPRWDRFASSARGLGATSRAVAPAAAETAATTSPSTSGAGTARRARESSSAISRASSAESTALPMSISTTTPSPSSARLTASLMATASVPNPPSSSPAATSSASSPPCSISPARATAASASARLWETTTRPTVIDVPAPRAAAARRPAVRPTSPPGPGAPHCARRGSWPGPSAPPAGRWRPARRRPRPRRTAGPPPSGSPPASAASSASTAGASASYIVLSPGSALPAGDDAVDARAQRRRERGGLERDRAAGAVAMRRNNVPYSGPLAPPTVRHHRMPACLSSAAGSAAASRGGVELGDDRAHAAVEVRAVVGVADRRVELGQHVLPFG